MELPLINNVSDLTLEQVLDRINDLSRKYTIAQRSGNAHLCNQLRMALETFQNAYQERLRQSRQDPNGPDFDKIINIE